MRALATGPAPTRVGENVFCVRDTCNVYVLRRGRTAVLVDFGSGLVLDQLPELDVDEVTDVLVTHAHRDQVQGLDRAVAEGIRVWVPPVERDLVESADEHWSTRSLDNDYSLREDRFGLVSPVPVTGTVAEHRTALYGGLEVLTVPTPGHTVGSVTYLVHLDGRRLAFTGDLVYDEGRVWSLAATQWTYTGVEGLAMTVLSCQEVADLEADLLLPSHGRPVPHPRRALRLVAERLEELVAMRRGAPWDLTAWRESPFEELTPHLLLNRTSIATTYALLSDDGAALFLDYGYDLSTGMPAGSDRAARRPWLGSLRALRRDHGVDRVEVAVPTHYHDDHVAGFNLLRDVEGTQVWSTPDIAPVLTHPRSYDLPCLWYDPVPVDRVLPFSRPVRWREYELTLHPLPGHCRYAVAIEVEVDGRRVLATGDQQDGRWQPGRRREMLNYQYRNGFEVDDFRRSAQLYRRLAPDLMVSGHWTPREVTPDYLDMLVEEGERLARLHRELLPLDEVDFGAGGFGARVTPYRSRVPTGGSVTMQVAAVNPFPWPDTATVRLQPPAGWAVLPTTCRLELPGRTWGTAEFTVTPPPGETARRARVVADLTVGEVRFGQHAEALVDVVAG